MSKKQDPKKTKKIEIPLTPEEITELEILQDRISVQDPEGESLESYLKSLRSALGSRENMIAALIDRLSARPSPVGFKAYQVLQDAVADKHLKRLVRKAAYRFSQRGFTETAEAPSAEPVVLIQSETRKPVAHFAVGEGTLWFVTAFIPSKGMLMPAAVTLFVETGTNHLHTHIVESSHRLYKDYLQRIATHLPDKPQEIPMWHAARLFRDMDILFGEHRADRDFDGVRGLLEPFYEPDRRPYAYEFLPEVDDPGSRIREVDVEELLKHIDASPLLFPKEGLLPINEKMKELESPVLVVPPEIQRERALELLKGAADELCTGKTRLLYQRFFEEQALWLQLTGKKEIALSAWIVAQHLKSGSSPSDNPILPQLLILSVDQHWPEEFDGGAEGGRDEPFRRTESGLILPT